MIKKNLTNLDVAINFLEHLKQEFKLANRK